MPTLSESLVQVVAHAPASDLLLVGYTAWCVGGMLLFGIALALHIVFSR